MKRKLGKALLVMAIALMVFIGKGSEAKAYYIIDGEFWMTWDEFNYMGQAGLLPLYSHVVILDEGFSTAKMELLSMGAATSYVSKENFDYDWYLQKHPELAATCGTDQDAVYSFYETTGRSTGWCGRVAANKMIGQQDFDYVRYAAENPDVAAIWGQDAAALYAHYVNNGMSEGREGYSTDDKINAYRRMYEVCSQIITPGMSDREVIKAVHDWMVMNIAYDCSEFGTIPEESCHIEGAINRGLAICHGYAETFQAFMGIEGINSIVVVGGTTGGAHAWNKVKVDGEYYYIDVTWDDPVPDRPGRVYGYKYYLTKDPTFGGDHMPHDDREF